MAESIVGGIKRASGSSIALGVLIVLLGIIAMMAPFGSGIVAVTILGWTAIFGGIAQIVYACHTHSGGRMVLKSSWDWSTSRWCLPDYPFRRRPADVHLAARWMLLGYGILAVVLAFRMRPEHGWGWILFDAIVTIVGLMILEHWPLNSAWVIGTCFRHQHSVQRNQPPDCLARSPESDIGVSVVTELRQRRYEEPGGFSF